MTSYSFMLVALGGAIGAVLRYAMGILVGVHVFPWATLGINILGAFAIGLLWGAHAQSDWFIQWGRLLLVVGALGGFTTFSTFSLETLSLLQGGRIGLGLGYAGASVMACLLAVLAGERCGQMI